MATRIRQATSTEEVAEVLTELTASYDGILNALGEVLTATADFYQDLRHSADPHSATRLRFLFAERRAAVDSDLRHTRNTFADRHAPHPYRIACSGAVPDARRPRPALARPTAPAGRHPRIR